MKISVKNKRDWSWGYFMVAPTMVGLFILNIFPIFQTMYLSFTKSGSFGKVTFVGLENYQNLIQDKLVIQSFINTFKYTLITVPLGVILSLLVAVLLNTKIRGKTIYRTLFFLPVVSAPAAVAMVWKWIFNSDYGLINNFLKFLGINGVNWLTNPNTAIWAVAIVGIWSMIGYNMIILLAGLQEIPETYYEAAKIDGAGPIRQFFNITLPLVTPTLFFVIITTLIGSLQVFDVIYMMISRSNAALPYVQSVVVLFYRYAFEMNMKGYGSAIIILLFVIILIITYVQLKLQKKWVHY
jgi:multiple sugar transport system permease protein